MAYIGYNTIGQVKKFTLTGKELVKRDLINLLNIRQGEMPGRPNVGTDIWSYVFEPNTDDTVRMIKAEMERVIDLDPRIQLNEMNVHNKNHHILVELNVTILPDVNPEVLNIIFDENLSSATLG